MHKIAYCPIVGGCCNKEEDEIRSKRESFFLAEPFRPDACMHDDEAIKIKPDKHEAWYNKGNSLTRLGRDEEAIKCYDEAIKIKPDKHQAWYNKGNSLANLGRDEEAKRCYEEATKIEKGAHNSEYQGMTDDSNTVEDY